MITWTHVGLFHPESELIYLPKKVCQITININTTDTQQQKYHNENSKIWMFIFYMYVDILFSLRKFIPIRMERIAIAKLYKHGETMI